MRKLMLFTSAVAMCLASAVTMAQTADRAATVNAQVERPAAAPGGEVTLIGCVMREADYRKMHNAGRGGVLGTGVGGGNEFVLVNANTLSQDEARRRSAARNSKEKMPPASVGTSGATGKTYGLTGEAEKNLVSDINRMVEVVGKIDNAAAEMPNVTISVWHPVGDYCPAAR
jgi:hypothetical protein